MNFGTIIWLGLSTFLIFIIFIRAPQNDGLVNFTSQNNLLGSPSSAEKFLNNLTAILIVLYMLIAIKFNFNNLEI